VRPGPHLNRGDVEARAPFGRAVHVLRLILTCAATALATAGGVAVAGDAPPAREGIFVPEPRDAGDTLDAGEADWGPGGGDRIVTAFGDILHGRVVRIDSDGRLVIRAPYLDGEVYLLPDAVLRIELSDPQIEAARDRVVLTNGDYIGGELMRITDAGAVVESPAVGFIQAPRSMLRAISSGDSFALLLDSDFAGGDISPWETLRGSWRADGDVLAAIPAGRDAEQVLVAEVEQNRALTFEVQLVKPSRLNMHIRLFADTKEARENGNSITAVFEGDDLHVYRPRNGFTQRVAQAACHFTPKQDTSLRCAYDPASSEVMVWLNARQLLRALVRQPVSAGKYVGIASQNSVTIRRMTVYEGIVPPSAGPAEAEQNVEVVLLSNGDLIRATSVRLADSRLRIVTELGELTPRLDEVSRILFRTDGKMEPQGDTDVVVQTGSTRLALRLESMDADVLVGTSPVLGRVRLARSTVRSIVRRRPE